MNSDLLAVENLRSVFDTPEGTVRAVDDVSFTIAAQRTLGLVGESGCGKTVTALSILRLLQPRAQQFCRDLDLVQQFHMSGTIS